MNIKIDGTVYDVYSIPDIAVRTTEFGYKARIKFKAESFMAGRIETLFNVTCLHVVRSKDKVEFEHKFYDRSVPYHIIDIVSIEMVPDTEKHDRWWEFDQKKVKSAECSQGIV